MDINVAVVGQASEFWEECKSRIDFPFCSRDDQEQFSIEFRVWRDTRNPGFVLDLSSPVLVELPLLANVLRNYTLEFEIRVKRALTDLWECLREVVKYRDYCRELTNTLMEDIEEMSSVYGSKLATLRAELDRKGSAPSSIEAECVQLRFRIMSLEGELAALTRRFVALDHSCDEERAALEAARPRLTAGLIV